MYINKFFKHMFQNKNPWSTNFKIIRNLPVILVLRNRSETGIKWRILYLIEKLYFRALDQDDMRNEAVRNLTRTKSNSREMLYNSYQDLETHNTHKFIKLRKTQYWQNKK